MKIEVWLEYHGVRIDRVLETETGEILHREFPSGALRHEAWLYELDENQRSMILSRI
ncbi:hypothetical protein LLH00_13295 [bacterium]|nr:hypothetical protein [bacterium]